MSSVGPPVPETEAAVEGQATVERSRTPIDAAASVLDGRLVAVLTGAGISTDSGIPDYRGEGSAVRNPMSFSQFLSDERYRKRYWAGSQLGWERFTAVVPNDGHRALTHLERGGVVRGVITQNVDGLHQRSGGRKVVELHGSNDRVRCLSCGQVYARPAIAMTLVEDNPWLADVGASRLGPDGDVDISRTDELIVPACTVCGGILRPDIVYFGEFVPVTMFAQARGLIRSADALLIVGSSLVVNSGIRLLDQAIRRRMPVVIVNRGVTKGDSRATVKIDAGATPTLTALAQRLTR